MIRRQKEIGGDAAADLFDAGLFPRRLAFPWLGAAAARLRVGAIGPDLLLVDITTRRGHRRRLRRLLLTFAATRAHQPAPTTGPAPSDCRAKALPLAKPIWTRLGSGMGTVFSYRWQRRRQ